MTQDADPPVRRVSRETIFSCNRFEVVRDVQQLPDGSLEAWHSIVPGTEMVQVLPLERDGHVTLLEAYRPQVGRWVLEVVGGVCDAGETPIQAAIRELHEETGMRGMLTSLGSHILATGVFPRREHLFLAEIEETAEPGLEPFEQHTVRALRRVPLAEAVDLALSGEVVGYGSALTILKGAEVARRGGLAR